MNIEGCEYKKKLREKSQIGPIWLDVVFVDDERQDISDSGHVMWKLTSEQDMEQGETDPVQEDWKIIKDL